MLWRPCYCKKRILYQHGGSMYLESEIPRHTRGKFAVGVFPPFGAGFGSGRSDPKISGHRQPAKPTQQLAADPDTW
jgi:hypothetical protein